MVLFKRKLVYPANDIRYDNCPEDEREKTERKIKECIWDETDERLRVDSKDQTS